MPQRYRQKHSENHPTYTNAKMTANTDKWQDVERKRIKRRPDGSFDLIEYEEIPGWLVQP